MSGSINNVYQHSLKETCDDQTDDSNQLLIKSEKVKVNVDDDVKAHQSHIEEMINHYQMSNSSSDAEVITSSDEEFSVSIIHRPIKEVPWTFLDYKAKHDGCSESSSDIEVISNSSNEYCATIETSSTSQKTYASSSEKLGQSVDDWYEVKESQLFETEKSLMPDTEVVSNCPETDCFVVDSLALHQTSYLSTLEKEEKSINKGLKVENFDVDSLQTDLSTKILKSDTKFTSDSSESDYVASESSFVDQKLLLKQVEIEKEFFDSWSEDNKTGLLKTEANQKKSDVEVLDKNSVSFPHEVKFFRKKLLSKYQTISCTPFNKIFLVILVLLLSLACFGAYKYLDNNVEPANAVLKGIVSTKDLGLVRYHKEKRKDIGAILERLLKETDSLEDINKHKKVTKIVIYFNPLKYESLKHINGLSKKTSAFFDYLKDNITKIMKRLQLVMVSI